MDIVTKTSQVVKGVQTRKDYDQLLEVKKKGAGRINKRKPKKEAIKSNSTGSRTCPPCLWTCLSLPFIGIKHLFKCTCLKNFNQKNANVIKAIIGFLIGLLLGWIYFWFLDSVVETNRRFTIISSVFVLILLSFGLAFSNYVRIMCMISIATICSSTGRAILIMIIFVEVYKGPVVNTAYNLHQVGSSISCGADVIKGDSNKTITEQLSDKSKEIFNAVIDPIRKYNSKLALTIATITTATAGMVNKVKKIKAIYDKLNVKCSKIAKKIKISCDQIGKTNWWKGSLCKLMELFGALKVILIN